jgi:hypothetical protein
MKARGLRRGGGGDRRTPAGRSRTSMASLGFRQRTVASRWQARARLTPERSFNVRVAEVSSIEEARALIAEASLQARRARHRKDPAAQMLAVASRLAAKRRAGQLLLGGVPAAGIRESTARRWRRLA